MIAKDGLLYSEGVLRSASAVDFIYPRVACNLRVCGRKARNSYKKYATRAPELPRHSAEFDEPAP